MLLEQKLANKEEEEEKKQSTVEEYRQTVTIGKEKMQSVSSDSGISMEIHTHRHTHPLLRRKLPTTKKEKNNESKAFFSTKKSRATRFLTGRASYNDSRLASNSRASRRKF